MNDDKDLTKEINKALAKVLNHICLNPLVFVSEADVQALVMHALLQIDDDRIKNLHATGCTIGRNTSGTEKPSANRYKTMLIHKEYGHVGIDNARSDLVIFNPDDVGKIIDPINLKTGKGKDDYLTPDYIFEFGTEKSAGGVKDFEKHLHKDLKKVEKVEQAWLHNSYSA